MKIPITLATAIAAGLFFVGHASADQHEPIPSIHVDGVGVVEFEPDLATVRFTVEAKDRDADDARTEVDAVVNGMLRSLDQIVDRDDIVAQTMRLAPRYDYRDGRRVFNSYVATRQVIVEVRDLSLVGRVVQVAVVDEPISVDSVSFGLEDESAAKDAALAEAVADARNAAGIIAEGLGVTLGAPLEVRRHGGAQPMPRMMEGAMMARASADTAPGEFRPDALSFHATVSVRFAIGTE